MRGEKSHDRTNLTEMEKCEGITCVLVVLYQDLAQIKMRSSAS